MKRNMTNTAIAMLITRKAGIFNAFDSMSDDVDMVPGDRVQ